MIWPINSISCRVEFNRRVHTGNVDLLSVSNGWRKFFHGLEKVHCEGSAFLASGEAKHPLDVTRISVERREIDHHSTTMAVVHNLFLDEVIYPNLRL